MFWLFFTFTWQEKAARTGSRAAGVQPHQGISAARSDACPSRPLPAAATVTCQFFKAL